MKLYKLNELLTVILTDTFSEDLAHSELYCRGDELAISFNGQPSHDLDRYLKRKGFIYDDGDYIYRPRKRST